MSNTQRPEPQAKGDGSTLDFHSMFFTLQGEGPFTGQRSIFVRLAGCNLQCPGCDTEYTEGRVERSLDDIIMDIHDLAVKHELGKGSLIVITGGEPLRQCIGPLVTQLIDAEYMVQIESNGVFAPDPELARRLAWTKRAVLIVSPKTSRINEVSASLASAFKYVLDHTSISERDGLPLQALGHPAAKGVARPLPDVPVYVNPYDSGDPLWNHENLMACRDSALRYGYICGIQMHKLLNLA